MTEAKILVLDQGTTSTRAVLYDDAARVLGIAQRELPQSYPRAGWVEHDPIRIAQDAEACAREVLEQAGASAAGLLGVGITNQRETTVLWERATGKPLHPAIVWQDRRTADRCRALKERGLEERVQARTGLLLDPYFSATKLGWLLDELPDARRRAEAGQLAFGTIDSWLIFRLTGGAVHATDVTNASRTLLCALDEPAWDEELLALFDIPAALLPEIRDNVDDFGAVRKGLLGHAVPIRGVAGDQQAAAFGQAVRSDGLIKSTYGTGCFTLRHCGEVVPHSRNRLLATVAARIGGHTTYALEGSIFNAGTVVQWLRDQLGLIRRAEDSEKLMREADPDSEVVFVPAFTGLGAPWWDPHARGALFGLTRDTGPAEIVRAGLDSVAWQTLDLIEATAADTGAAPELIRVDGGMARNDAFLQRLADVLQTPVQRPEDTETTALGAALLTGHAAGLWPDEAALASCWRLDREFAPSMEPGRQQVGRTRWRAAVGRLLEKGATDPSAAC